MRIGIAGAGGIGSNVALNLVRSGVKNIKIVDFDKIEESNLNRQFYFYDQIGKYKADTVQENIRRLSPECGIEAINMKLNRENIAEVFDDCDIVVEAFDKKEMKKILLEELGNEKKVIISANGIAGDDLSEVKTLKFGKNCFIVGDLKNDVEDKKIYPAKVIYIAAIMSDIVLKNVTT